MGRGGELAGRGAPGREASSPEGPHRWPRLLWARIWQEKGYALVQILHPVVCSYTTCGQCIVRQVSTGNVSTYRSEQYRIELLGTKICFSHMALYVVSP